jgi:glyoxylase-like metal-dependent hydrolase (beta-lactamase superfamily II)
MIVTSHSDNVLGGTSGRWRVWSLSDGYIEMPADLLRDPQNNPVPQAALAGALRLSVNCFALAGPGVDGVLIDSGGGGWAPTVGRLERTMAEARIDPASITVLALTHTHQDHVHGLLTPDGRVLFPNLKAIVIPEAAMESFFAEVHLARFRPLLKSVRNGDQVAFGNPAFSWGYDDDQPTARATRLKVFHDAAETGAWIAGAHLGWPGIGRVVRKGEAYGYEPATG